MFCRLFSFVPHLLFRYEYARESLIPVIICYVIISNQKFESIEKYQLTPVNGRIALPDRPGFGIVLDESKIVDKELLTWE